MVVDCCGLGVSSGKKLGQKFVTGTIRASIRRLIEEVAYALGSGLSNYFRFLNTIYLIVPLFGLGDLVGAAADIRADSQSRVSEKSPSTLTVSILIEFII